MKPSNKPRIKICCISSVEEAKTAIELGASALGLVGPMPSGPGIIDNSLIAEITKTIPPPIASFLLTSKTTPKEIVDHHRVVNTNTIQIVDALSEGTYEEIKSEIPMVKLVQVIHVIDNNSVKEAIEISESVDALLLDSGNPNLKVKVLGGTGQTHNWELSTKIREEVDIPVFLAGGINPENIREAFETVRPYGIDLCSGVRTDGQLDKEKLRTLFSNIK